MIKKKFLGRKLSIHVELVINFFVLKYLTKDKATKLTPMYQRKSRMSTRQHYRLIEHFVAGITARAASQIIGVQATTSARFYMRIRKFIASKLPSYELYGQI